MTTKQAFVGLLSIALFFAVVDFGVNKLWRYFPGDEPVAQTISGKVQSQLPPAFLKKLGKNVSVQESIQAGTLFNRLIVSELPIKEALQTSLLEGIQKFGVIYEFSGGEATYFQLRSGLELILTKDDTLYDANNLGDYSVYYNDTKRQDTVFLLSLIKNRVWGFEYPKKYHGQFKELVKTLL